MCMYICMNESKAKAEKENKTRKKIEILVFVVLKAMKVSNVKK